MQWRKCPLFVEATANLVHNDTDNKEDLGHPCNFPQMSQMPNSLQETLWLISSTKEFITPFEKLLLSLPKSLRPS